MGHVVPLMQQDIRASGVACQPAQTARFPAHKARTATTAALRRDVITVHLACGTARGVSNRRPSDPAARDLSEHRSLDASREHWQKHPSFRMFRVLLPKSRNPSSLDSAPDVNGIARLVVLDLIARKFVHQQT